MAMEPKRSKRRELPHECTPNDGRFTKAKSFIGMTTIRHMSYKVHMTITCLTSSEKGWKVYTMQPNKSFNGKLYDS